MKRKALSAGVALFLVAAALVFWVARRPSVTIGAVYPTGGGQGPGGVEEYRGLTLAADLQSRGVVPISELERPARGNRGCGVVSGQR